jgi:hypothetical protein
MRYLPNGDLVEIPVVRPATADPQNFHDTLMKAEKLTSHEQQQLIWALDNYIDTL